MKIVKNSKGTNGSANADEPNGMAELRQLILGPEQQNLKSLEDRNSNLKKQVIELRDQILLLDDIISNKDNHAESIGDSLAEAFVSRHRDDEAGEHDVKLPEAVVPVIEESLNLSVEEDPEKLAAAIYPIMLPAISKAIKQALQKMMQEINRTLDQQLSPKSFGWRMRAWKSGRSYAEIVLSETLEFRVEQAFLIHKETGLLLLHSSLEKSSDDGDADVISAMLTAIQDFVKDSFTSDKSDALDTLNVGELTVWVERAPLAYLAVVIRGQPPLDLREDIQNILLKIHGRHRLDLTDFDGDQEQLAPSQALLNKCLMTEFKEKKSERSADEVASQKKSSRKKNLLKFAAVLLLALLLYNAFKSYQWNRYVDDLAEIPGVIIIDDSYKSIRGLLNKDTKLTTTDLDSRGFNSEIVDYHWTRFESFGEDVISK